MHVWHLHLYVVQRTTIYGDNENGNQLMVLCFFSPAGVRATLAQPISFLILGFFSNLVPVAGAKWIGQVREIYSIWEREILHIRIEILKRNNISERNSFGEWEKYSRWQQSKVQLHFLGSCSPTRCNDDLAVYLPKLWRAFYRINASVKVGSFSINGHLHWHWKKRDILHSYGHLWGSDESLNW